MNLKEKNKYLNLKNNRGVTLADITIAIIVISLFSGVIASMMAKSYSMAIEVQQTANADAYATMIMEKVDEKPFEAIDQNFVKTLTDSETKEIEVAEGYQIEFSVVDRDKYKINDQSIFKEVTVTVKYGNDKQITLKKLKVKEMGNM